ncbi:MAG: hypothetical protein GC134_07325 [Proteobacteria bacterium]|nr:hypothetical protein [Pseudomonadota bacterium]
MLKRWYIWVLLAGLLPALPAAAEEGGTGNPLVDKSVNEADFESAAAGEAAKVSAEELAKPLSDEFGMKSEAKLKDTMNYDDCFDWSYKVKIYPACPGSCPGKGCFPLADVTFTYTEPTVMVQTVREPGAGSLESVPGQKSQLKQVLSMGTPSGRSAPGVSPLRSNMPTAGYMPQLYFESHVWGISPAARFESSAGQMDVKKSLSCDIADEVSTWPAAVVPTLYLAALPPIVISKAILGNWGWKWFRNAGSSQIAALIGNQTISDIASTASFVSDAAGSISDVGGTATGEAGNGAGLSVPTGDTGTAAAAGAGAGLGGLNLGSVTGAIGDGLGQVGGGIKDAATAVVGSDVVDSAGNVVGTISDTAGTVVNGAGEAIGQFNSATGQIMNGAGDAIGQITSQLGAGISQITGGIGQAIAPVTGAIGQVTGQISGAVGQVTQGIGQAIAPVTGAISGAVGQVTGAIGEAFGGVTKSLQEGIGQLFSGDSMLGSLGNLTEGLSALGTLGDIAGMAGSFMNSLSALTNLFSDVKLAPNYISEMQETSWRHGPPGVLASLKSMIGSTPFLCTPGSVLSEIGIDAVSNALSSICVGSWGPLEPRMGWVPTSGDPFPASGLAGYRAYKNIEYSIWNYKRHTRGPQRFNLDYPHKTKCENIGTPDLRWESRAANATATPMLDLASNVFGVTETTGADGATSSVQNYVAAKAGLSDSRLEASEYVYTYWKDSNCTMTVCTADWEVLRNKWKY